LLPSIDEECIVGLLRSWFSAKPAGHSPETGNEATALRLEPSVRAPTEAGAGDVLIAEVNAESTAANGARLLERIDQMLAGTPDEAGLLHARSRVLYRWGRMHEALRAAMHAEARGRRDPAASTLLGWICVAIGQLEKAEVAMRNVVVADPGSSRAHVDLAVILQMQGHLDEAARSHEHALVLDPRNIQSLINLGTCKVDQSDFAAAESYFRRAIAVDSDRARAWANLAVSLARQDCYDQAFEAFARAEDFENKTGEDVENFVNFALHLREAGQLQAGIDLYEKHLPSRPSLAGHNDYAFGLLTAGRFLEGWHHYEFRWMQKPLLSARPRSRQLRWSGQSLQNKTILLRIEQGFGDAIQFLRYAPALQALGATVLLGKFSELAHCFKGIDRVVDRGLPASVCDYYIDIVSLPRIFGTELETIPAEVPYIEAPRELVERWSERLGGQGVLKVGVVWAGNPEHKNDRYRSIRLVALTPLWQVAGVRFISLQKGAAAAEWAELPAGLDSVNLGPELTDFTDTAAVISELDLVLCVDTAVAHLAGALGKPVWLLVAQPADFRWLERREDSPWYPTMRLFRQSRRGDWDEVIERVKVALQARVRDGMPTVASVQHTQALPPLRPLSTLEELLAGHRPGLSAVAETRAGIVQYQPDEPLVGASIAWYGEYLQPQLDLLARLIRPGATVLEAGAGVGMHALFLGAVIGPSGHLFLYEPRPVVQRILRQNLGANGMGNVTVMRRGLGRGAADTATEAPLHESVDELRLERLDWLKVDDGSGVAVLEGAADTLWRLRPGLFIAAADQATLGTLAEQAKTFSYRCWRLETALFNTANFNLRDTDIFVGGKALALLALPEEIDTDVALDQCVEI
jgi:tetratricopeptide (TPR) repeat protein